MRHLGRVRRMDALCSWPAPLLPPLARSDSGLQFATKLQIDQWLLKKQDIYSVFVGDQTKPNRA